MIVPRLGPAAAVLCGKIYVVGGYNGKQGYLHSTERYDPDKNVWTSLALLNKERAFHRCCVVNGLLYAIGGYNALNGLGHYLDYIERYDQEINKWILVIQFERQSTSNKISSAIFYFGFIRLRLVWKFHAASLEL